MASKATLFCNSVTIRAADRDMKDYIHSDSCRHQELINHFSHSAGIEKPQGHLCCDICAAKCACGKQLCKSDVFLPVFNGNDKSNIRIRNVSDTKRQEPRAGLNMLVKSILTKNITGEKQKVIAVSLPNNLMEFDVKVIDQVIDQVIENAHLIFTVEDVMPYIDVWQKTCSVNCNEDHDGEDHDSNEWEQIIEDPSLLCLLNEVEWQVDSLCLESEHSSYPQVVENAIDNIHVEGSTL